MNAQVRPLLIISRDLLLQARNGVHSEPLFRLLAGLGRRGYRIILTASEPERWLPTRGTVDQALVDQQELTRGVRSAGGDLDGVYYVPRSLLTQDRNRTGALEDILARYGVKAGAAILISSSTPFLRAAERLGIAIREIALAGKPGDSVLGALETLAAD